MDARKRKAWRKKNLKLVYFGSNRHDQDKAEMNFWLHATSDQKHEAMRQIVRDELKRLKLTKHGPELLRLTALFQPG